MSEPATQSATAAGAAAAPDIRGYSHANILVTDLAAAHDFYIDKLGFEVLPVPFRDAYAFGGGLHCATADVHREGSCEDYFPNQVPGTQISAP